MIKVMFNFNITIAQSIWNKSLGMNLFSTFCTIEIAADLNKFLYLLLKP